MSSGNKLLCEHEIAYVKKKKDKSIDGYDFRYYYDHMNSSSNLEVETQFCRKPFFIDCDRVNDLPGLKKVIWEL
jgi:hypothetical protein